MGAYISKNSVSKSVYPQSNTIASSAQIAQPILPITLLILVGQLAFLTLQHTNNTGTSASLDFLPNLKGHFDVLRYLETIMSPYTNPSKSTRKAITQKGAYIMTAKRGETCWAS